MDLRTAIRPGRAADAEATALLVGIADSARRGAPPDEARITERSVRRLLDPRTFFFVAEPPKDAVTAAPLIGAAAGMDGRLDGGAGARIPGLCHISMVAVHPRYWGQGLGRRMVQAILVEAPQRDYDRAQLFTHKHNERARALYEGQGFTLTGHVAVDEFGDEILHYILPLADSPVGMDERLHGQG